MSGSPGRRRVLLVSTLVAAPAIALPLSLRLTPLWSLALFLPYYLASSIRFPTSSTIALSLLPTARGTMMAARGLTITMGGMIGTILTGFPFEVFGVAAVGAAYAILTTAGFVIY